MKNEDLFNDSHSATYCPEDDKIRLYVGRVPRDEYEALRAEGWTSTPKQDCDFVAVWTPQREDTALSYAGIILDEDQGPADRAADRAERFTGYLEKRLSEATGHADRYDAGPSAHGYQNQARADRAAARHDRHAGRAVNAWSKAEYWTSRTAGVISNALYKSAPAVRMGRIKTIEAELRKAEKNREEYGSHFRMIQKIAADPDKAAAEYLAASPYSETLEDATRSLCEHIAGLGTHRNPANLEAPAGYYFEHMQSENPPTLADYAARYLETHTEPDSEAYEETGNARFINHCKLRLAYENQMLEAQGGRAAFVEMEPGGWIYGGRFLSKEWRQIQKVNKSPKTGRVVSVLVKDNRPSSVNHWGNPYPEGVTKTLAHEVKTERMEEDAYRAPTEEEKAAFLTAKADAKKNRPKSTAPPLINPTDEDAERLQALWNQEKADRYKDDKYRNPEPQQVLRMTQARYSDLSKGSYAHCKTREYHALGKEVSRSYGYTKTSKEAGPVLFKLRTTYGAGGYTDNAHRVIVITDKPQKPLPAATWQEVTEAPAPTPAPAQIETPKAEKPTELSPVIAGAMATLENLTQAELFA